MLESSGMRCYKNAVFAALTSLTLLPVGIAQQSNHLFFRVTLGQQEKAKVSGRVLIFLKEGAGEKSIDINPFSPTPVYIAAKEVTNLKPGGSVDVDTDDLAYPDGFSELKPGNYQMQAVLDTQHTYGYSGRGAGDLVSAVTELKGWAPGRGAEPELTLSEAAEERKAAELPADEEKAAHLEDFVSPSLSRFFGWAVHIRAWVFVPPGYDADLNQRFLSAYWTHGFGGQLNYAKASGAAIYKRMESGKMPPMIWIMLDESWLTGTHEFADSVNNGPWGSALVNEFIPYLESRYRMSGGANGRFLNGHSSGGWATLQLQVNYPETFGGTWSTSPDPSDFHDFSGVDLYAPHANMYRRPDGTAVPIVRADGKVVATMEQFARMERVLGEYGGQIGSFEWVFSPRGADGRPLTMFDRDTGEVHPEVVAYWRDHFDLAHKVTANWSAHGSELRSKIHLFVGTADTFYLDGAAHKFEAVLNGLNADPHFTYLSGRTHFDLYKVGDDRQGLFDQIGAEMWAAGHGGQAWKK